MLSKGSTEGMIFCVENDNALRDLMLYAPEAASFKAKGFLDSTGFFEALAQDTPQLVLLDIMLPGEDGITILKMLRLNAATRHIPVIMAAVKLHDAAIELQSEPGKGTTITVIFQKDPHKQE